MLFLQTDRALISLGRMPRRRNICMVALAIAASPAFPGLTTKLGRFADPRHADKNDWVSTGRTE